LVEVIVPGEDGDGSTAGDEAAEDVLLDTAVYQSNLDISEGVELIDFLGRGLGDEVADVGVRELNDLLVLQNLISNLELGQGRSLITEQMNDRTGVDSRDGRNALASTPLSKRLNGSPMRVLCCVIVDDNSLALDLVRLKVLEQAKLILLLRGNTIVSDQGLGKDQDLTTVRGVGHRLGVSDQGGSEDCFSRDVRLGSESLSMEDGSILPICISN